ncbi:PrsW family glutamic-type intramembrane protease [Chryseosolibacter indicus]|uniref:Protease PrsW n=1 Tax=Chryseosolibacter indicus TaxID=2782351 RepID=A0ABS5VNT7_9BACT|nr:PrsW family intramembrane metalloprotease [Chryseosolibacter indicus]
MLELLGIALAPGVAIMLYIYLKDKHEREPLHLLITSFLYGAFSTLVTLVISWPLNTFLILKEGDIVDEFFTAFFKVALVEEFSKFFFVRFILYPNRNFNEPFDGIVYAVMVSMGFATLENIMYIFEYGFQTGILRMFTAVPAHATFGVMMGFYLGKSKFTHSRTLYFGFLALIAPTIFHGSYDYFWFIAEVKDVWAGIWVFAIISLVLGLILSRNAIRLHQQASPFNTATVDENNRI